jgi:hypothetical protein
MNVSATAILDIQGNIEQNIQTFLNTHGSDIANKKGFTVLKRSLWCYGPEAFQIGAVPNHKDILRIPASAADGQ